MIDLKSIYRDVLDGKIKETLTADVINNINQRALEIYSKQSLDPEEIQDLDLILRLSNALYNSTSYDVLVLDDGMYDILLEKYKKINPSFQVGGATIKDQVNERIIKVNGKTKTVKRMNAFEMYNPKEISDYHYTGAFMESNVNRSQPAYESNVKAKTNRLRDTAHEYEELVGTLDKCKFVLDSQAEKAGVYDDSNVKIFERDFLGEHIHRGIIQPYQQLEMIGEIKYDGLSVEATCSDRVISARTRGDLDDNRATDLTDILYGYRFPNHLSENDTIGVKFEAIITKGDLLRLYNETGKEYKNMRTAIAGILGASNARDFIDYVTLVPLATSRPNDFVNREAEIQFLNKYFATKQTLRYVKFFGNPTQLLYQINEFTKTAEKMRGFMNFAYDGVVVSYTDRNLIEFLGRVNHINKYSIAIKFNPAVRYTRFRGYEYTIGQNGIVTPMIYFDPIEFNGTIHKKASGHSYERFKDLALHYNDILEVSYVNDVMPYVTKKICQENEENDKLYPKEKFIERCPYCGAYLQESDTGKSIRCPNLENCPGVTASRMSNMLSKLDFKNFSYESIVKLKIASLYDLLHVNIDQLHESGIVGLFADNFMKQIKILTEKPIKDSKIIGALGFSNIAQGKWAKILEQISLDDILNLSDDALEYKLVRAKSIGRLTAKIILEERYRFKPDLILIQSMPNVIKTSNGKATIKVRFSGIRNKELASKLEDKMCDVSDGAVTKDTKYLVVPYEGYSSSKVDKANNYGVKIIPIDEFANNLGKYIK